MGIPSESYELQRSSPCTKQGGILLPKTMIDLGFSQSGSNYAPAFCLSSQESQESVYASLSHITAYAEHAILKSVLEGPMPPSDSKLDFIFGDDALTRIQQLFNSNPSSNNSSIIGTLGINVKIVDAITGVETGAYSQAANMIFISDWLIQSHTLDQCAEVLIEEIGHAIDSIINPFKDSMGDEGELFSAYVLGKSLEQLPGSVYSENDTGNISYLGSDVIVEFNKSVTLFQDAAFKGRSKPFGIGNYAFIGSDFNDIATSISIAPNQNIVVELYEHANFQGRSTVVSYSQASIGADWNDPNWRVSHLNDAISSLRVREQRPSEIILYQHSNFQGLGHSEQLGNKRIARFNDDYSSIDLPRSAVIDVFEHTNYGGRKITLTRDSATLGVLNDRVSSFQAYRPTNISEVANVMYDRLMIMNPSQVSNGLWWYALLTNNSAMRSALKWVNPIAGIITAFDKVRTGDPVNGIMELLRVPPMSPVKYIPKPLLVPVESGFRAITGEVNGVKISDLLKW